MVIEGNSEESVGMFGSDFIRLDENDELHQQIKKRFLLDLEGFDLQTEVVSIHRNSCSSSYWQGKLKAFQSYIKTHEEIGNGNANLRQAWFSASKAHIVSILSRGYFSEAINNGIYGRGLYLSPLIVDCLQSSVPDEDGVRYMVCCRIIMGQMEILRPISKQICSSSNEYHSGVDDLLYPTKYIISNGYTNSHIFPVFVISFKSSNAVLPEATTTQKEMVQDQDLLKNILQAETWENIFERFDSYLQAPPICNQYENGMIENRFGNCSTQNGLPSRSTTPSSISVPNDDVQKCPADEPRGSPTVEKQHTVHTDEEAIDPMQPLLCDALPGLREWFYENLRFYKGLQP